MNTYKAILDTRRPNGVIATITQFDNATLSLQIVTNGEIEHPWEAPQFELIAMKRDQQAVRESDQAAFTINDAGEHRVTVDLKEQFLTCRGSVKMQFIVKDGDRLSTSIFYVMVGESLDHDIIESHRDVAVLDELETYVKQGFDDLAYQEQRMKDVEKATHELNELMVGNEAERQAAEANRQALFEGNESQRQNTFNQQLTSQRREFDTSQADREGVFNALKQNLSSEFNAAQNEREREFDRVMASNQTQFNDAETSRASTFSHRQLENEHTFTANENARQTLFNANEAGRQTNEAGRVSNENTRKTNEAGRVAAEANRQQKMSEFEAKATQLSDELDVQVARVDAFVSANEEKLLGDRDKVDYMGNTHESVKAASDANVDWLLGEVNTAHYEGQHITATETIEGRAKSAILKGQTLVNIATKHEGGYDVGGEVIMTPTLLKANTKYYIKVIDDEFNLNRASFRTKDWTDRWYYATNGVVILTTPSQDEFNNYMYLTFNVIKNGETVEINNTIRDRLKWIICEYQEDMENWDIPHFEGMQSVKMPVLSTIGKNLFDGKFTKYEGVYGYYYLNNGTYTCSITDNDTSVDVSNLSFGVRDKDGLIWLFDEGTMYNTKRTITNGKLIFYPNTEEAFNKIKQRYHIQVEEGTVATPYEPYKSNILTSSEEVVLRGIGNVKDTLDVSIGEKVERIGEIVLDGSEDENWTYNGQYDVFVCEDLIYNNNYLSTHLLEKTTWNGVVRFDLTPSHYGITSASSGREYLSQNPITIQYELATPVIKTVDLSDNHVYSYKDVTHYDCSSAEGSLVPTLSIDVPTNLPAVVTRQRATIQELEKENAALKNEIEETANSSVNGDLELMSSQFELDFRLFEIEMNLDMPMMATMRGVKSMAMTVYQQAKTLILAGKYEREDMEYKLNRYKAAGRITVEEYDELIALMDARELVD